MLNVEIRLPGTGQHYDFALDETAPVAAVTRAVAEAICAETHAPAPGDTPLSLYDPARAARLRERHLRHGHDRHGGSGTRHAAPG